MKYMQMKPPWPDWMVRHHPEWHGAQLVDSRDIMRQNYRPGDMVAGILPMSLVAQLTERGVRFFSWTLKGRGIYARTVDDLEHLHPGVLEYAVFRGQNAHKMMLLADSLAHVEEL